MHGANYKNSMMQARYIISRTTFERRPYGSSDLNFEAQFVCQRSKKCICESFVILQGRIWDFKMGVGAVKSSCRAHRERKSEREVGPLRRKSRASYLLRLGKFFIDIPTIQVIRTVYSCITMEILHRSTYKYICYYS